MTRFQRLMRLDAWTTQQLHRVEVRWALYNRHHYRSSRREDAADLAAYRAAMREPGEPVPYDPEDLLARFYSTEPL